jgi:uncharacterized membrane protein
MSAFFSAVAEGALQSGVNGSTYAALNGVLLLVVLSLVPLLAVALAGAPALVPHVLALLAIALALWGCVIYVVGVLATEEKPQTGDSKSSADKE